MTHPASSASAASNEFDAAKTIVETLQGLDKQLQARAIRFAIESLGLPAAFSGTSSVTSLTASSPLSNAVELPASHGSSSRPKDIRQFTAEKLPKNDVQFAAIVAYYHRFEASEGERKETINAADLTEAARLVQRERPPAPGQTLINAKNTGYLDLVGGGAYKINTVGENLVAVTLPGNGSDSSPRRKAPKKKGSKTIALKSKKSKISG